MLPPHEPQAERSPADYRLEIAPVKLELSPRHKLDTIGYNSQAPGPLLRLKEGQPVTIEVTNRTERPDVVHWHGLFLPPAIDGSVEEGTPAILPGTTARYRLEPHPPGFRWYHTHMPAMGALKGAQYGAEHGLLLIEPRSNPARYDQELFITLHDWEGYLVASDDGSIQVAYNLSTINGKIMGFGEPLRVTQGQRVLVHVLNSSPTEVHWLALSGHALQVVALDGNPVPTPRTVSMLRLAPAERVCAVIEMNNPGVWVLGEVRRHVQAAGMAIAVEYAGRTGKPLWQQPSELLWNYGQFAAQGEAAADTTAIVVPLAFESRFRGHGAMEAWTINGRSYPDSHIAPLLPDRRYRLQLINRSNDDHPIHLHRHSFEVRALGLPVDGAASAVTQLRGLMKDVVLVEAHTRADVEFTADHPGATLFHCHQQDHMDNGFMMLIEYA